jgi:hypothetical protein
MNFVLVGPAIGPAAAPRKAATPQSEPGGQPRSTRTTGSNRRWANRTPLDRAGVLGSNRMIGSVNCIVRNTSRHGALLEIASGPANADTLPECFTLVFLVNRIRSEVNCVVRWRARNQVGVQFAGPIHTSVATRG